MLGTTERAQTETAQRDGDHNSTAEMLRTKTNRFCRPLAGGRTGEHPPGSTPHKSVPESDEGPKSEDSENGQPHDKLRVFRFVAQSTVEPQTPHTVNIQRLRRAAKSEDSEHHTLPHNNFRVFIFPVRLAAGT